jgi:hypothetical protein
MNRATFFKHFELDSLYHKVQEFLLLLIATASK